MSLFTPHSSIVTRITHPPHFAVIIAPVLADFDPHFQVDLTVQQTLNGVARVGADLLQHLAATADEDALLRIALDVDGGRDVYRAALPLIVLLDDDGDGVRYFLLQVQQD